jgi:hypothetical protein
VSAGIVLTCKNCVPRVEAQQKALIDALVKNEGGARVEKMQVYFSPPCLRDIGCANSFRCIVFLAFNVRWYVAMIF